MKHFIIVQSKTKQFFILCGLVLHRLKSFKITFKVSILQLPEFLLRQEKSLAYFYLYCRSLVDTENHIYCLPFKKLKKNMLVFYCLKGFVSNNCGYIFKTASSCIIKFFFIILCVFSQTIILQNIYRCGAFSIHST